jgi:type IV secretory pathway VirJ component
MRSTLKVLGFVLAAGTLLYVLSRLALLPDTGTKQPPLSGGLPLVELPVARADNDLLAIILSGDGGWADLDRDFGQAFQARGVATVGFDCLKYFWKARQPPEVAADLERAIRRYLDAWSKRRLLLVGFSFGADWLPSLVNRLPADLQERVALVVLLAPEDTFNLEIKVGDWLSDSVRPGALEVLPEAARLRPPVLCVYGTDEADKSICPRLKAPNVRVLPRPGGHHFNQDYAPIEDAILYGLK